MSNFAAGVLVFPAGEFLIFITYSKSLGQFNRLVPLD
jgi:hypothetical protein